VDPGAERADDARRSDGLGVRLGWAPPDEKEEPALAAVMERLRHEGEGILLIFDNATDADALKPYLPRGGAARVLVTSNAPAWRGVAEPVEIRLWPKEVGADYLVARTGRDSQREAAEDLSEALGGLPLAHEQAAAYCERLEIPLPEYHRRFTAAPVQMLDTVRDAPAEYHDKLTVAKTFALAIDEAAKLHPAAEPLLVHASLLAPEPIPLFLFAKAREKFGEPLASALADDGLDEAEAALRAFALVDRETIVDERDPAVATDTIRLHRLVREIAAARRDAAVREDVRRTLVEVMAAVYPEQVFVDPKTWQRARRLDGMALALIGEDTPLPSSAAEPASYLMDRLASYRHGPLGAYMAARALFERALSIRETAFGPEDLLTGVILNNLGGALKDQGDLGTARPILQRALAIYEKAFGAEDRRTTGVLTNLAIILYRKGDYATARALFERALAIYEKVLGPEHPDTAAILDNLAGVVKAQGDLAAARLLFERALAIFEKALGPEHPSTLETLDNLAGLIQAQGDLPSARLLYEQALAAREKVLGPEHWVTAASLNNLASLLRAQGKLAAARQLLERALAIFEKALGPEHPHSATARRNLEVLRVARE
jgi:tetratricopeptide (TPR) repeat protein